MSRSMSRMLIWTSIFFVAVFTIYAIKKLIFIGFMMFYQQPPVTVSATIAKTKTWQSYVESIGTLKAVNGVDLSTEVPGIVKEIHFSSGQFVKKNDLLIKFDTSIEDANLESALAKLTLAKMNYVRQKILRDKKVSSQSAYDETYAQLQEAQAAVDSFMAQIKQKTIVAPFDGKLGIRQINQGQFLPPGTTMVTLQALDPLYVMLNVPEQYVPQLYNNQPVDVYVNGDETKQLAGKITAINAKVNPSTRNILIEVTIPNSKFQYYPGMFATAKIHLQPTQKEITLPQSSIAYDLNGDYVFVLKKKLESKKEVVRAYRKNIKVGEHRIDEVSILDGIQAGDLIVTSGQLKLKDGMSVVIDQNIEM